jgi:nucleotide-binding universal stress UspA family protein
MKVVVAIDDSPQSQHMLDLIVRREWANDTEFKVVHVVEPLNASDWSGDGWMEMQHDVLRRRHKGAEKLCSDARHKLESHIPTSIVHYEVREGNPKAEIVYAATQWDANKVIIGAHSREVCPHNSLGSVSRSVAEQSSCTVEIIRIGAAAKAPRKEKAKSAK